MRLRILHVTPYGEDAWAYGGIPRVVGTLTHGLAARGHHVTVCATDAHGESTRHPGRHTAACDNVAQFFFPNISNRLAYRHQAFIPLGFRNYLRHHVTDFDVAHLHACRNLPCEFAAYYLQRAGIPYV